MIAGGYSARVMRSSTWQQSPPYVRAGTRLAPAYIGQHGLQRVAIIPDEQMIELRQTAERVEKAYRQATAP